MIQTHLIILLATIQYCYIAPISGTLPSSKKMTSAHLVSIKFDHRIKSFSVEEMMKLNLEDLLCIFMMDLLDDQSDLIHSDIGHDEFNSLFYFAHAPQKFIRSTLPIHLYLPHFENIAPYELKACHDFGLVGGKGGFGSLLRHSKSKKKTTNFSAMRDLSGRRFRQIRNQIDLERWKEAVERKKQEAKEKKEKAREEKRAKAREQVTILKNEIAEKEEQVANAIHIAISNNHSNNSVASSSYETYGSSSTVPAQKRKTKFDHGLSDDDDSEDDNTEEEVKL